MNKSRKKQYKKIIPFVITVVASVSLSFAMFMVFAAGQFDRLAQSALTAATLNALEEDIPEGVAPFYKITTFSKNKPSDADVIGVPLLTLRDRILLTEPNIEVKAALYSMNNLQQVPYFSFTINNGNDQSYEVGQYGAGDFVIITTKTTDCWGQPLSVCVSSVDKVAEWHYKVVADTFTYIIASLDKREVALRNARKNSDTNAASTTEMVVEEDKGVLETIVDTVVELFGGDDTATEGGQTDASAPAESSGFQIIPSDETETAAEGEESSISAESSDEVVEPADVPAPESAPESSPESAPAPAESSVPSEGNNE